MARSDKCSDVRNSMIARFLFVLVGLSFPQVSSGQELKVLETRLKGMAEAHEGEVSFVVKHLATGDTINYEADRVMPTASLIKIAIMVEAYRQAHEDGLDLDELVTLEEEDKVPGSGILTTHFSAGARLSLRDVIRLMIAYSDNTATNLVLDRVGIDSTCETMIEWGLVETKINSKVFRRDTSVNMDRSVKYGLGSTTANETASLLEMLSNGELFVESLNEQMMQHLRACDDDTKIKSQLPSGTIVAHKTGAISNVRCDGGIIETSSGPLVVVVLTNKNSDQSWTSDNAAQRLCGSIARAAFDHFHRESGSEPSRILAVGSTGRLVEALQRTLNDRMDPSPGLAVDGDFGPNTENAVKTFQVSKDLEETGVVDETTWSALGTLLLTEAPVASPDEINSMIRIRAPEDALEGEPFVTCQAWAIADRESGEVMFEKNSNSSRDIASTTKIMTALVVLDWARQDESRLEEIVTFSRQADETIGSTAGLNAGEQISVRELLYGLLLPSGNDASVALAEHVGRSMLGSDDELVEDDESKLDELTLNRLGYERFVEEMNAQSKRLGMDATTYRNPHGLTENGHKSSAADLLKVARAALGDPLFAEIVNTDQRGAKVGSELGYERNVKWTNTNRLLRIEGYGGVKTGTTRAAGACLVALAHLEERELLIVILGATSSDARYVDARNLVRHAKASLQSESQNN